MLPRMSIHTIRTTRFGARDFNMAVALAAMVCAVLSACGGSSSDENADQPASVSETARTAAGKPAALGVRSTLDGKSVLPQRVRWVGKPTLPESEIDEVAFLIDGTVRWVEHEAPYSYSEDGGFLVTTWLTPGRHRFTVRVRSADGRTARRTVRARVRPAPAVPEALAGTWYRHVSQAVGNSPAGKYTLVFERRWLQDRAPGKWDPDTSGDTGFGGIIDNYWIPAPDTFKIAGSVNFRPLRDTDAEGGWWCEPGGPSATYQWSVAGNTLTLAPVGGIDACDQRGAIYTGKWQRAG